MNRTVLWLTAGMLGLPITAMAAPQLDLLYGDHAVIQRGRPVSITGSATSGETVTVKLGEKSAAVVSDGAGRFTARFDPISAAGPIALSVESATGKAASEDVRIGDVFLCSGQSNMEMPVRGAQDAFGQAFSSADPDLRLMTIEKKVSYAPDETFARPAAWQVAGPQSVMDFSANCYYMAKELRKSEGVPRR